MIPLALAILCAGAGAFLQIQSSHRTPQPDSAAVAALDSDAATIAGAIDTVANEARLRAQSVASTPMLRAAIETDAATVQDMVRDGALVRPGDGDVMEVVQLRDGTRTPLVRVPATAPPVADPGPGATATVVDGKLRIIAGAPVLNNANAQGGVVWLSEPVDLQAAASGLRGHALAARIDGLKAPLALVPATQGAGDEVTRPIAPRSLQGAKLALVATIGRVMPPDPYRLPAYGCFGAGGLLLLIVVVGSILHRSRARGHS